LSRLLFHALLRVFVFARHVVTSLWVRVRPVSEYRKPGALGWAGLPE
jgi:hypothetical protein